jgi:RsmE family RNA methyltransferase
MNLVLLEGEGAGGRFTLTGRRARHAREVLRVAVGRELRVGVPRGPRGVGRVVSVDGDVTLECRFEPDAPPPPWLDVILAVPRPKALARALESLASFGVRRIDLVNAWRVDKSFLDSPRLDEAAVHEALVLGCEQGGTTWIPEVTLHPLLVPFLEETLAPRLLADGARRRLLAHPRAAGLETIPRHGGPVIVAVGPERGWIDAELESFARLDFAAFSVGPATLRVEPALAAIVGQLWLWRRL